MVYGLGSLPFKQRDGVRISVGSQRSGAVRLARWAHNPEAVGSNPTSATQSGVVQWQDIALLRQLSGLSRYPRLGYFTSDRSRAPSMAARSLRAAMDRRSPSHGSTGLMIPRMCALRRTLHTQASL